MTFTAAPRVRQLRTLSLGLAATALLLGSAAPGQAGPGRRDPIGGLTPEQQQKIFPEFRSLMLQDHQARISILQQGERCLRGARTTDALRSCLRQERSSYRSQRSDHRNRMREMFQRNGLPVPEWGRRGSRSGARRGDGTV